MLRKFTPYQSTNGNNGFAKECDLYAKIADQNCEVYFESFLIDPYFIMKSYLTEIVPKLL